MEIIQGTLRGPDALAEESYPASWRSSRAGAGDVRKEFTTGIQLHLKSSASDLDARQRSRAHTVAHA